MARPRFILGDVEKTVPAAPWTRAITSDRDPARTLPQAIGHRGYKALYPENTMAAFEGVVKAGAHAVETDLHLSADGVVVLSHDATLTRCFGVNKRIDECTWDELATLRTINEPRQSMPRLKDLLEWLTEPERENIWVLVDVKIDDDPEQLLRAVAELLDDFPGPVPWNERLLIACWNATFLCTAHRLLPGYPLALTTLYIPYASLFLPLPNVHFNVNAGVLAGPLGAHFLRAAGRRGRFLAGVISDDPGRYLEVCDRVEDELDAEQKGLGAGRRWWNEPFGWLADGFEVVRAHLRPTLVHFHRMYVQGLYDVPDISDS